MRLIDADALKELYNGNGTFTSAHFRTAIDEMPTITIEPERKKGRWMNSGIETICSNCYYKLETTGLLSNCPNCGVKMEIYDYVSDFQPTRKDVEKAFDILLDKSKENEK